MDHDTWDYLHTGRNSTDKRACLEAYIWYRFQDLEEALIETFEIPENKQDDMTCDEYLKLMDDQYILDDMVCCNFELIEHEEPIDED